MAEDMIDRVAKAIEEAPEYGVRTNKSNDPSQRYEVFYFDDDGDPVVVSSFPMSDHADSEQYSRQREALARAAIEAMRDPTGEMKDAGAEAVHYNADWSVSLHGHPTKTWQAMIDAVFAKAEG